ncbi:similar to Saccharomyces cerevisiae YKL130C SHE2 RNA-binding protein that binds specific mRNAs and interacts with She3p [Maudiozyma barnettii]|uniref:Similar to Saccharomyces cerevisiae YKL130C SHE2 RNA-binding protein that binds specific mRNAs and interacts with She3p n=1 Tax=Maudiozyma barnettii TaxID=61262 RepID=A0A8H2VKP3_9SACH|nr:She2p [Kazachstania barnettii]CAB4257128.1 similar to Saccharomyces cerevisiae YKL130C SHE2 RNA-binding protein that binds specific mRNAs and interacts with She3p [Kazachstania barnettii]CAD1779498.1 similar to Saccharomyces cerevisiae YKL130C SHE2 RNA-binding protein that binds specific mRNAs and interacts with She3p [Kazachstania barnettii]
MSNGLTESSWSMENLQVTDEIINSLAKILQVYSDYLSSHIHVLNKFISHMRRVSTLRFERTTLIKYVKKLRFFNDVLIEYDLTKSGAYNDNIGGLSEGIKPIGMYLEKILEILDLLNFYLTQSLQKEIISKTLNEDLTLTESSIVAINDTYNHFVKYTQWMIDSLGIKSDLLQLEVIKFALKCAEEDGTDMEETENIFLHQVMPVNNEGEYALLTDQWSSVLEGKLDILKNEYASLADKWHEKFGKAKN